jgi:hypothetical protein
MFLKLIFNAIRKYLQYTTSVYLGTFTNLKGNMIGWNTYLHNLPLSVAYIQT